GSSFAVVPTLSTPPRWFACARLRDPHLTRSRRAFSSPLTTRALDPRSVRGFAASSCKAAARGLPSSHVPPGCVRALTSYALLHAVVAHDHPHIVPDLLCSHVPQPYGCGFVGGTSLEVLAPVHPMPCWPARARVE